MNNFFSVLLTTLKNSIISVWTKVRYWLTPSFWQSKVLTGLRNFLQKLFDVKPHDKNDYFTVRNWMISRRLGFAVVIVVGLISLYFLITVAGSLGLGKAASDGVRVYRYTSIPLRFAEGNVKIKARSGYIAYEGNVKDGYAEGYGNLYSKDSNLIYSGEFEHGRYNGTGTLFYADGQTQYEGEFADNCFQGTGILYRLNGSKEYEGDFLNGCKEGQGSLFDSGDNIIFTGAFHCDGLVYSQLLAKKTSEIGNIYTGSSRIYSNDADTLVYMEDIQAMYRIDQMQTSVEDEPVISQVYVLNSELIYGQTVISSLDDLTKVMGEPEFQGNTYITLPEAVAVELINQKGNPLNIDTQLETAAIYDEVQTVKSYRTMSEIYLYVYQTDDLIYTFFCEDRNAPFFMYMIEQV